MAAAKMSVITPKHASNTVTKKSGAVLSVDAVILARALAHALRWGRSCRYGPLYLTPCGGRQDELLVLYNSRSYRGSYWVHVAHLEPPQPHRTSSRPRRASHEQPSRERRVPERSGGGSARPRGRRAIGRVPCGGRSQWAPAWPRWPLGSPRSPTLRCTLLWAKASSVVWCSSPTGERQSDDAERESRSERTHALPRAPRARQLGSACQPERGATEKKNRTHALSP